MFFFTKKSTIHIPKNVYEEIIAHAKDSYPNECCGLLVGNNIAAKKVFYSHRAANVNKERAADRYIIDPNEIHLIDRQARTEGLDLLGFYHSHPDHPDRPSDFDREWGQPGYSYVIIAVKGGKDVSIKSWTFIEDGSPFKEEGIKVT